MPQLAVFYEKGCKDVFNSGTIIGKDLYPKFQETDNKLRKLNIYPKDYAYGIMNYLKTWTQKKGWKKMPISVFCGEWAIGLYCKKIKSVNFTDTPEDDMLEGMLLHDELIVARYALTRGIGIGEAVRELNIFLSEQWLEAYKNHKRIRVVARSLEVLSVEVGKVLDSYDEFLSSTELFDDHISIQ